MATKRPRPLRIRIPVTKSNANVKGSTAPLIDAEHSIPNTDVITEEIKDEKGEVVEYRQREIRYVKNHRSIYVDEQTDLPKDPKTGRYMSTRNDLIKLHKGNLYAYPDREANLVAFLKACDYNGSKEGRDTSKSVLFYVVDAQAQNELEAKKYQQRQQAMSALTDISKDEAAIYRLGATYGYGETTESTEILVHLYKKAEVNPKDILDRLVALKVDLTETVEKAEKLGVISVSPSKAIWSTDGTTMLAFQPGTKGTDARQKLAKWLNEPKQADTLAILKTKTEQASKEKLQESVS